MRKLVLAISGASGVCLANRFYQEAKKSCDVYVVYSKSSESVIRQEQGEEIISMFKGEKVYASSQIDAPIASGSFGVEMMAVIPTSMNTLAKIAYGLGDDLITRCASVMLKEKKTLLLAPREMPFSSIALENMTKLSALGVVIAPPVMGYYSKSESLEDMESFLVGKWLDVLGISNTIYPRWGER